MTSAPALIGRRTDSDIAVSHRLTSRQHAHVMREGDAWFLIDLQSSHRVLRGHWRKHA